MSYSIIYIWKQCSAADEGNDDTRTRNEGEKLWMKSLHKNLLMNGMIWYHDFKPHTNAGKWFMKIFYALWKILQLLDNDQRGKNRKCSDMNHNKGDIISSIHSAWATNRNRLKICIMFLRHKNSGVLAVKWYCLSNSSPLVDHSPLTSMTSFLCFPQPGRTYSYVIKNLLDGVMFCILNALRNCTKCFWMVFGSPALIPPKARA